MHFAFELEDIIPEGQLFPRELGLRNGEFGVKNPRLEAAESSAQPILSQKVIVLTNSLIVFAPIVLTR